MPPPSTCMDGTSELREQILSNAVLVFQQNAKAFYQEAQASPPLTQAFQVSIVFLEAHQQYQAVLTGPCTKEYGDYPFLMRGVEDKSAKDALENLLVFTAKSLPYVLGEKYLGVRKGGKFTGDGASDLGASRA